MGVTIYYRLSMPKVNVKATLDRTQAIAEAMKKGQADKLGVPFEIRREEDNRLYIDIGECETLVFAFYTVRELVSAKDEPVNGPKGWNDKAWKYQCLTRNGQALPDEDYEIDRFPQNEIAYSSGFCKTQFARILAEHRWVAELIRSVASYCLTSDVSDEGDYYHSGDIRDAGEAIGENGKLIDSIGGMLKGAGWEGVEVVKGGETVIKGRKRNTK